MNYKEKTSKISYSFIRTSYGSKAYWWGLLFPMIITVVCWTSFFTLISSTNELNHLELAKSVAFFIGGVVAVCTWCIGNMLFGLMFKDYADSVENDTNQKG